MKEGDVANSSFDKINSLKNSDEYSRSRLLKKSHGGRQISAPQAPQPQPQPEAKPAGQTEANGKAPADVKPAEADSLEPKPIGSSCCLCCKKFKYIRVNPKTKRPAASIDNLLQIKEYLFQSYNSRPLKPAELKIYKDFSLNFQLKFIECNYLNSKVIPAHRSWSRSSKRWTTAIRNTITAQL